ncbi:MAG: hypothetical protein KC609_01795 [Myxococcales bacterium]|nr:hypothetical protein [Myxococcales bacterium]
MAAASLTGVGYAQYRYYAIPTPVCRAHQRYHNRREWALLALGLGGFVLCAGLLLAVFALAMRFLPGAWPLVPALVPFGFGILYLRRRILRFRADGGFGVSYDAARNVVVFDSACAAFLQAAQARDARARCEDASS